LRVEEPGTSKSLLKNSTHTTKAIAAEFFIIRNRGYILLKIGFVLKKKYGLGGVALAPDLAYIMHCLHP